MDKTHNIGLGGISFIIEEKAFLTLKNYLAAIRMQLSKEESREEIITDIEYRMVELLKERLKSREIIENEDVDYLIGVLGAPMAYASEDNFEEESKTYKEFTQRNAKKLFRDIDYRKIGGVLSGVSYYVNIERTWLRLGFVLFPIFGILFHSFWKILWMEMIFYAIFWIIVPVAQTTSKKLEMRGEAVNIDSIKEFSGGNRGVERKSHQKNTVEIIAKIAKVIAKIIAILLLIFIGMVVISLILTIIAAIFGVSIGMGTASIVFSDYASVILGNSWETWFLYIALFLATVVPLIGIMAFITSSISERFKMRKNILIGSVFAFFIGMLSIIVLSIYVLKDFSHTESMIVKKYLPIQGDTLVLSSGKIFNNKEIKDYDGPFIFSKGQYACKIGNGLKIKTTKGNTPYLSIEKKARGNNAADAEKNAQAINYSIQLEENRLTLNRFLSMDTHQKWRAQEVEINLYLPENKYIKLKDGFYIKTDDYGELFGSLNKIYGFKNGEFSCIGCKSTDNEETVEDKYEKTNGATKSTTEKMKISEDSTKSKKIVDVQIDA